ncbi:hypothetical protein [Ornithinibacillus halophilus]|uniref:Uncharacterized protein n=1 Tax=Ornithinibacillus halophilus TaxID=930117 RepID=A0A1M5P5U9_9BACI|nr:hypothetical protein [Ornithinibacillus halophilus]SHG96583.1 hypothetical protein SAMN05216225_11032 [Ornithinibacillus halophilus]
MLHSLKASSGISKAAAVVLFIGGFITAKEFAIIIIDLFTPWLPKIRYLWEVLINGYYGWGLHIGLLLFIGSIIFLYKRREIITTPQTIVRVVVAAIAFSGLIAGSYHVVYDELIGEFDTLFIDDKLLGEFGFGYHIGLFIFLAGTLYLLIPQFQKREKNHNYNTNKPEPIVNEETKPTYKEASDLRNGQLSVWQWVGTLLLLAIPLVNLILLLIWGFGADNPRKNFSLGALIYSAIIIVISFLFFFFILLLSNIAMY